MMRKRQPNNSENKKTVDRLGGSTNDQFQKSTSSSHSPQKSQEYSGSNSALRKPNSPMSSEINGDQSSGLGFEYMHSINLSKDLVTPQGSYGSISGGISALGLASPHGGSSGILGNSSPQRLNSNRRMSLFVTNRIPAKALERRMSDSLSQLEPHTEEVTVLGSEQVSLITLVFHDEILEKEYLNYLEGEAPTKHWQSFFFLYMVVGLCTFFPFVALQRFLGSNYPYGYDLLLMLGGWVLPYNLFLIGSNSLKSNGLSKYIGHLSVLLNWFTTGIGILGHWYFVDRECIPSAPFTVYLPALFSYHIFNFVPFRLSLISVLVLVLNYFVLAHLNDYFTAPSFLYVVLSILVSSTLVVYICYQQERANREQFFNSRKLNTANLKLVTQLRNLQLSYGRKALDFDSPLEKATLLARSLLADSTLAPNQLETLSLIVNLLNAGNLFAPDLDNQVKGGRLKMDLQQEKWLFSEIVKRNGNLGARKRKSITSLTNVKTTPDSPNPPFSVVSNSSVSSSAAAGSRGSAESVQTVSALENTVASIYLLMQSQGRKGFRRGINELPQKHRFCREVAKALESFDDFNFPIFSLQESSLNQPLLISSIYLFEKYSLFANLGIKREIFCRCIATIESGYRADIPYHTSTHAADVLHAMYYFCSHSDVKKVVTDADLLCLFYSAIIHDYDHPGVNNNFLSATLDSKALLYNDRSILENHHLASSFEQFLKPGNNFVVDALTPQEFKEFRNSTIELVLATDLAKHFEILSIFKNKVADTKFSPDENKEDHMLLFKILIKCADVCNSSKSLPIHKRWVKLVLEEFFKQGDQERELNIPISPLMDRTTVNIASSQAGFIDFICTPLFEALNKFTPIPEVIVGLDQNREYWAREKESGDNKGIDFL